MEEILTKVELRRIVKRFIEDKNRGISIKLFCEIAGVSESNLYRVFIYHEEMTETVQRRVSKGYNKWHRGELAVMQNRDTTVYVEYRKQPKPRLVRGYGIEFQNGKIKMKIGIRNKADYDLTLDEQFT